MTRPDEPRPRPDDGEETSGADGDDELSPKAREVKRRLEEGTYEVDLDKLADRLLDADALDPEVEEPEGEPEPDPGGGEAD